MNRDDALRQLEPYYARGQSFSGWDFSDVRVRRLDQRPPWNYELVVKDAAKGSSIALDMGTGGGELLAKLRNELPFFLAATEEWKANAPIAHRRLNPLGASVIRTRNRQLPFRSKVFDLVINRHEELDPAEVARVLVPGGLIVTQQVGGRNWEEARKHLPRMTDFGDLRQQYSAGLKEAGLKVTMDMEDNYRVAFGSLDDFVFMLSATPWTLPGFSLQRDIGGLLSMERECSTRDGLVLTENRFLLAAKKPTVVQPKDQGEMLSDPKESLQAVTLRHD